MRLTSLAGLAALSTLAACAGTTSPIAAGSGEGSAYGLFLAGQGADYRGDARSAQGYYAAAKAAGASGLDDRMFMAALSGGDVGAAARLAPALPAPAPAAADAASASASDDSDAADADGPVYQLGVIARVVSRMSAGDGKGALSLLTNEPTSLLRTVSAQLTPWAQLMAGQGVDLSAKAGSPAGLISHAHLAEAAGKAEVASADYQTLDQAGLSSLSVIDYGTFLERQGQADQALALYNRQLAADPDRRDVLAAKARVLAKGKAPPMVSPRQGAAQVMFNQAALMGQAGADQLETEFIRFGLALDPNENAAWIELGDELADGGDTDGARGAYAKVPLDAPEGPAALARVAATQQDDGDGAQAIKTAERAIAIKPQDSGAAATYAAILAANQRYAEADKVYGDLIASATPPDWRLYYQRWSLREAAGQETAAEGDLQSALALAPDEPTLLNALGYIWVDRGENLDQAMTMLRKAANAQPHNGEIVDSLGWAYFRQGDFPDAVAQLETAVELEPAIAEINDHLGDAYWRAGRETEARFQWQRTLTLDPDPDLKAKVQAKLQSGLPATALAPAAPPAAGS